MSLNTLGSFYKSLRGRDYLSKLRSVSFGGERSCQEFIERLTFTLMLVFPNPLRSFEVYNDASSEGLRCRHHLYGVKFMVLVIIRALSTYLNQELNIRKNMWMNLLKDCDFELKYHLNKANAVVDPLSKKSLHMMMHEMENIRKTHSMLKSISLKEPPHFFEVKNWTILFQRKVCVPKDARLRNKILEKHIEMDSWYNLELPRGKEISKGCFSGLSIEKDMVEFVAMYLTCQQVKIISHLACCNP
ncbi:hypothetical protein CR513_47265, partial [Mucuna pruriens]